jgi:hypothetical protein
MNPERPLISKLYLLLVGFDLIRTKRNVDPLTFFKPRGSSHFIGQKIHDPNLCVNRINALQADLSLLRFDRGRLYDLRYFPRLMGLGSSAHLTLQEQRRAFAAMNCYQSLAAGGCKIWWRRS